MRVLSILLCSALLAGCSSPASGPEAASSEADASALEPSVDRREFEGGIWGAAGASTQLESVKPITLLAGAVRIVYTLSWNGTGDLDAAMRSPGFCPRSQLSGTLLDDEDCYLRTMQVRQTGEGWFHAAGGDASAPDSPSVLEIGAEDLAKWGCGEPECKWYPQVFANGAVRAPYEGVIEVHYGSLPPRDISG